MSDNKQHGVIEMLTWNDGTIMARWRPDSGHDETVVADKDPSIVNQTMHRWIADMGRQGWREAGSNGPVTHMERRPPKRHSQS